MRKVKREKITTIIIHIVVWTVITVLPIYSARRFRMGSNFLITYYTFTIISGLIFYINYLYFVPKLFFKKQKYSYYIASLALILGFYFISDFANEKVFSYIKKESNREQVNLTLREGLRPPMPPMGGMIRIQVPHAHLFGYLSSSLFMFFLSLGLKVLERQSIIEKMHEETEKSKLSAELAFLKNQISPHFFFNTLNNIYSLIGRNNEDSRNAVIKLSKMMRYVLNESGNENKPLSDEIEFMNNYIDLMKLRISAKNRLSVNFPTGHNDLMIPHLLFVSLIENAFKYGISVQEESYVDISLRCREDTLLFKCENGLPESNNGTIFASTGIGLENLQKRLRLIYPGRHELTINRTSDKFEVNLIIQLYK